MPQSKLFQSWSWSRGLPEPFNDPAVTSPRTDTVSKYNSMASPKATFHAATLRGILAYMDLDSSIGTPTTDAKGAVGTQSEEIIVTEYPSKSDATHAVNFNKNSGKFTVGCFSDPTATPEVYTLKDTGESGAALFFVLMLPALDDSEFSEQYNLLAEERQKCHLWRIRGATGRKCGKNSMTATKHEDFFGKYALSTRKFSGRESMLIPSLPSWYVIPTEVVQLCNYSLKTTGSEAPMRNFMLRGLQEPARPRVQIDCTTIVRDLPKRVAPMQSV